LLRVWCASHQGAISRVIVDSLAADHPTDGQLVVMAHQYFKKYDAMAVAPSMA
jgi:hypothetical protein